MLTSALINTLSAGLSAASPAMVAMANAESPIEEAITLVGVPGLTLIAPHEKAKSDSPAYLNPSLASAKVY